MLPYLPLRAPFLLLVSLYLTLLCMFVVLPRLNVCEFMVSCFVWNYGYICQLPHTGHIDCVSLANPLCLVPVHLKVLQRLLLGTIPILPAVAGVSLIQSC